MKRGLRWFLLLAAAGLLGGVGGAMRFAASDVPWPTFSAALADVMKLAALGTGLRIILQDFAGLMRGPPRIGTFLANLLGTTALAFAFEHHNTVFFSWAFIVGFCGGLTTFSGFVAESLALVEQRRRLRAAGYVGVTFVLCLWAYGVMHSSSEASFPWRTFAVNLSGCLLFGLIEALTESHALRRLFLSGLLGGYTTLSTLVAETLAVATTDLRAAILNVLAQVVGGGALIILGRRLGGCWRRGATKTQVASSFVAEARGDVDQD